MTRPPTAERPLLGQTVLVVEDSRFACEALRMICQRSGARIRRADSLRSAARHLRTYRPGVVLVDVGLPDGSGVDLIEKLAKADPPINVIIAMSGDDGYADAAKSAGANAFIAKPITSISAFQSAILAELPRDARPTALRVVTSDEVVPDRIALRDDLALAFDLLAPEPDEATLDYLGTFLLGLAKSSDDDDLVEAVQTLASARGSEPKTSAALETLRWILQDRLDTEQAV